VAATVLTGHSPSFGERTDTMAAPLDDRQPELNDLQIYFVRELV
jgi:hypothetical protein